MVTVKLVRKKQLLKDDKDHCFPFFLIYWNMELYNSISNANNMSLYQHSIAVQTSIGSCRNRKLNFGWRFGECFGLSTSHWQYLTIYSTINFERRDFIIKISIQWTILYMKRFEDRKIIFNKKILKMLICL